jgi:hypothetical protein
VVEPDFLEMPVLPFRISERPLTRIQAGEDRDFAAAVAPSSVTAVLSN